MHDWGHFARIIVLALGLSLVATPAFAFIDIFAHILFGAVAGSAFKDPCAKKFRKYNPKTGIGIAPDGKKWHCHAAR